MFGRIFSLCLSLFAFAAMVAQASAGDGPVVPGFERFHAGEGKPDAAGGALLLNELNCSSCHPGLAHAGSQSKRQAPVLTSVGSRVRPEYLRKFIANPHQAKPGTVMPNLFATMDQQQRDSSVEALTHFLASTGSVVQLPSNKAAAKRGEKLFHTVGCVACHNSRKDGAEQLATSVPLTSIEQKYTLGSLSAFLSDPHAVRPSGRMPSLNLKQDEARDLACYFLRDIDVPANISYAYYEGDWKELPDFSTLTPKTKGTTTGIDLSVAERNQRFAIVFEGYLNIPRDTSYTIFLGSDDGSRILIDGVEVVNVDGIHPHSEKSDKIRMEAGRHKVVVEYFEGGGQKSLKVDFKEKKGPRQPLGNVLMLTASDDGDAVAKSFQVDPDLVAKGRDLFASVGCASCHEMKIDNQVLASTLTVPKLAGSGGCLAKTVSGKAADFGLNDQQRTAINAALGANHSVADEASTIAFTMKTLNCYACHKRDEIGGPEAARNQLFTSTIPEMGDEGRVPPPLDGVGDKLNDKWLKHVMNNGANDRPYMKTRMPKFGQANVGGITAAFAKLDRKTKSPDVEFDVALHRVQSSGRKMVGDQGGLACVKCHYFGKFKSTGIQALDLTTMTQRLRKDWFLRYLVNPQAYRPGTRMPTGFPGGVSVMPDILDGEPQTQVSAIWTYLEGGSKAALPSGLTGGMIELKPKDEPIIYRNFIEGVSPRAVAVGYPEKAHLAYDAEQFSVALIWHGAFIDASKHWNGRGQGFQTPLGDHVMPMVKGQPFAALESADSEWPTQEPREAGYRFAGYRLDEKGRPAFNYRFGELFVQDDFAAVPGKSDASFERTISISGGKGQSLYFRAARAASIQRTKDGGFIVDNSVTLTFKGPSGAGAVVRTSGGQQELLVPVVWSSRSRDRGEIVEVITW